MTALTTYGTIGIKVWINRGDLLQADTEEAPAMREQEVKSATPW